MPSLKFELGKHSKSFSKFTIIGIVFYFLATAGNWLTIDYLEGDPLLSATAVMGGLFFAKYWAYRTTGVMHAAFGKYCLGSAAMTLLGILVIWLLVDFANLTGAISTVLAYGTIFVGRYVAFHKLKILNH